MANFALPHFGYLDPAALEEYYDIDIPFNDSKIQIDLNFENKTIDTTRLETVKHFIENIRIHDLKNKGFIKADYEDEEGDSLIDPNTRKADHENQLLNKLHLLRVGIYPDSTGQFAIFDYSLGQEMTNYLVVINTDENGNLDYMTMES